MKVRNLKLTNFRSHRSSVFDFNKTNVIIGKNTAGKTNILESLNILSHGRSFRAERDLDTIREGNDFTKIEAKIEQDDETTDLKVIFSLQRGFLSKKFLVNNVARRQNDFASNFISVLFTPQDIEILTESPSVRRRYIDTILFQADKKYRTALSLYDKALRHRNRMLSDIRDGKKQYRQEDFTYFNNILITQADHISTKRNELIEFVNNAKKDIFDFTLFYDKSEMSATRLEKYHFQEQAAGVTLVGPQRDDFAFYFGESKKPIREFGSRGEQRLTILQLKTLEISYLLEQTGFTPVLLLDDIFSELDDSNIHKIFDLLPNQQTIITTTHHEFVPKKILKHEDVKIIEL